MSYDESGRPFMITYANVSYYYLLNAQGDVVGIMNVSGDIMVEYTYDAWGNVLSITGPMADTMGQHNQLRYRGYVYDPETGLYFLNSRFYDPEKGRFINADSFAATGQGILGNNMFTYCHNRPNNAIDPSGHILIMVSFRDDNMDNMFWYPCGGGAGGVSMAGSLAAASNGIRQIDVEAERPGHTTSVGVNVSSSYGGPTGGTTLSISKDSSGNYAAQETIFEGASTGIGVNVGINATFTNASDVQDLAGRSDGFGVSIGHGIVVTIDFFTFSPASNPNSTKWGISVGIAFGGAYEAHGGSYFTKSTESWNPTWWWSGR